MDTRNEKGRGYDEELGRMAVDVDGLGMNWANQRVRINERIEGGREDGRVWRTAWAGAAAAAIAATFALVIWWRGAPIVGDGHDMDRFFTEVDVISEGYVPEGLYVLNGFIDEQPDVEAMVEFIVPQVGGEEEL